MQPSLCYCLVVGAVADADAHQKETRFQFQSLSTVSLIGAVINKAPLFASLSSRASKICFSALKLYKTMLGLVLGKVEILHLLVQWFP